MRSTETRIPLSVPVLGGNEVAYLNAIVPDSTFIAPSSVQLHEVGLSLRSSASLQRGDQDRVLSLLRRD